MSSLGKLAASHGLSGCVPLVDKLQPATTAPADATLSAAITSDPLVALDQARRRGLDPRLVEVFWKWLEPRPLELGLFAWDVLCGSLLRPKEDELLLARLRKAARVVADVLPEPGRGFAITSRISAAALVEKVAIPAYQQLSDEAQFEAAKLNALAALEVNLVVSEPGDADLAGALATAAQFAHYLQLAHLPTLATFYYDFLWKRAGQRALLPAYVEAMLDANAHGHYPERKELLVDHSVDEAELVGYLLGRDCVQLGTQSMMADDFRKAPHPIDYQHGKAVELARSFQRSHLVHAELLLDDGEVPVPFEVVQEVVKLNPSWRYAGRVRLALLGHLAAKESQQPLQVLDNFLQVFGNERWAWDELNLYAADDARWMPGLDARIAREVTALPHDRAAWEALGLVHLLSDDKQQWLAAIAARAAEQCRL